MKVILNRLHWKTIDYETWVTDQGTVVKLSIITPYLLTAVIRESVDTYLWESSTQKQKDVASSTKAVENEEPQG